MNLNRSAGERDVLVRRYEYADRWVVVADLGVGDGAIDVDVVGETAIVVADGEQAELELPGPATNVDVNNGVLTIEVEK